MPWIMFVIAILFFSACNDSGKWEKDNKTGKSLSLYQKKVRRHQDSTSYLFLSGANNVLDKNELKGASPLSYFPVSEEYRIKASFERILDGEVFEMKTNTERLPLYKPFGIFHFELKGDSLALTLYQSVEHPDYLFCPFKDQTSGKETYGAGRYLDFTLADTLNPVIDFNYCYNPYCAYNHNYSCPIPPPENHLRVRIEAGVKSWH